MNGSTEKKRNRGKPRQRWEKAITDTLSTMAAASRVAEDRHQFRKVIWAAVPRKGYHLRREEVDMVEGIVFAQLLVLKRVL